MRRRSSWADDGGAAAVEFVLVGLLMLVPLFYLLLAIAEVQSRAMGVEAASRQLAHVVAVAPDMKTRERRMAVVTEALALEYGMSAEDLTIVVTCEPGGEDCRQAGALARVVVRSSVALPLVPAILGLERMARVDVEATAVNRVGRAASASEETGG